MQWAVWGDAFVCVVVASACAPAVPAAPAQPATRADAGRSPFIMPRREVSHFEVAKVSRQLEARQRLELLPKPEPRVWGRDWQPGLSRCVHDQLRDERCVDARVTVTLRDGHAEVDTQIQAASTPTSKLVDDIASCVRDHLTVMASEWVPAGEAFGQSTRIPIRFDNTAACR